MTKRRTRGIMTPNELLICSCGYKAKNIEGSEYFTWANVDGNLELLCFGCTDKLHKNTMAEENRVKHD